MYVCMCVNKIHAAITLLIQMNSLFSVFFYGTKVLLISLLYNGIAGYSTENL